MDSENDFQTHDQTLFFNGWFGGPPLISETSIFGYVLKIYPPEV